MLSTNSVNLSEAIKFHGHLGPYLVLGILAGVHVLKKLKAEKYFGVEVKVRGVDKKPKSCFVDGLQLSTGATYGKGNILKLNGNSIKLSVKNCANNRRISLSLTKHLIKELDRAGTHKESERLARKILKTDPAELFNFTLSP